MCKRKRGHVNRLSQGELKLEVDRKGLRRVLVRCNRLDRFIGQEENIGGVRVLKQRGEVVTEESAGEAPGTG